MAERARILGNEVGGTPSVDASIWSQWQYLTEYPGVVRAEFGSDYLALPEEVLVTVMRVHQKQLPIRDRRASDKLIPRRPRQRPRSRWQRRVRQLVRHERALRRREVFLRDGQEADAGIAPRTAIAPAVSGEARQLSREDAAHRADCRGHLRRCRDPRRSAPLQDRSRHRDGEGVHRPAGAHRRHLRSRRGTAGEHLAGHLRSLSARQHRRCAAADAQRSGGLPRRQDRHAGRLFPHWREGPPARKIRSLFAAPRRVSCRFCSTATSAV